MLQITILMVKQTQMQKILRKLACKLYKVRAGHTLKEWRNIRKKNVLCQGPNYKLEGSISKRAQNYPVLTTVCSGVVFTKFRADLHLFYL